MDSLNVLVTLSRLSFVEHFSSYSVRFVLFAYARFVIQF